ncbi:hypothetical protein M407DRAFT_18956 [Tulasnella calospora MUT 4182]|uniref:Uncharacterized protein n=1 Tax=Tulasnella calospora MUT 4182 TaxID=1051891 RepID=A0A0C3LDX8_9AGAM|nr:hypothetical protein M407DRAFT_18956 [Tulasnella calospora MUT 4182]
MSHSSTSKPSTLVVSAYKDRNVVVLRPPTHEAAVRTAKATFTSLKAGPSNCITFSAVLVDYSDHGPLEISPESWNVASIGVDSFGVDIIEDGFDPSLQDRQPSSVVPDAPMASEPPRATEPPKGPERQQ